MTGLALGALPLLLAGSASAQNDLEDAAAMGVCAAIGGIALMIPIIFIAIGIGTAFVGLLLVGLIWGSTFTMQVPLHAQLSSGFEATAHRNLLATNWVRTVAWTLRAWLALAMILQLGSPAL